VRRPANTSGLPRALTTGKGFGGNREVPPLPAYLEEGGSWGKHGFPHGTERPAKPDAEDS